jgi:hypothetical protein
VFGHQRPDILGQVDDLAAPGTGDRRAGQPLPAPAARAGSWVTTAAGRPVISSVAPGWPFGRPGFRPLLLRSDLGAGLASPSLEGGFDEFRGF